MLKKLAVVTYVISKFGQITGKKALQKIIYFVSKFVGLDYDYKMYWYGPFSKELAELLDYLLIQGIISFEKSNRGTKILFIPNENNLRILKELASNLTDREKEIIDFILNKLSGLSPRQLELLATLDFVRTTMGDLSHEKEFEIIRNLKGEKFSEKDLEHARMFLSKLYDS